LTHSRPSPAIRQFLNVDFADECAAAETTTPQFLRQMISLEKSVLKNITKIDESRALNFI
jgi:hypothetical protein